MPPPSSRRSRREIEVLDRFVAPIALFIAAMAARCVSFHTIFQTDGILPGGYDAYYHLRRIRYTIEHFPEVLSFDPLMNFPEGAQPIWSPTFDWLIAAALLPIPGVGELAQFERCVVWAPPLIGAATVVLVYVIGLRFYSRSVGILAAMVLSVLPGHVFYSRLGNVDHHVMVSAASTVMLGLAMSLFRLDSRAEGGTANRYGMSLGLGASIAFLVLVWPGALLHVGVLQLAMIVRMLITDDRRIAMLWARRLALVHVVACLGVYPLSAGNQWVLWGSFSPVVLTSFQPLYFLAAASCFGLLAFGWRRESAFSSLPARAVSAVVVGGIVLGGLFAAIPELVDGLDDALRWFTKNEEFQAVVNESTPLFHGRAGVANATMLLSRFVFLAPVLCAVLTWSSRRHPDRLLLMWWTGAFFVTSLLQWRFVDTYSVAHGLLVGIALTSLYQGLRPSLTNAWRVGAASVVAAVCLALAFAPVMGLYEAHLDNVRRGLRGEDTPPRGELLEANFLRKASLFLRDYAPPLDPEPYSVLGPWGAGHIIKYVAGLPVIQDNFGDDVAPDNFRRADRYFAAKSEEAGLEAMAPANMRFVLVRPVGSGHSEGYSNQSMFMRLYHMRGSGGRIAARNGQLLPYVGPLHRHRLIYQSPRARKGDQRSFCMLFEVVAGAELVGRADPGSLVQISLSIHPRFGRDFEYSAEVEADSSGVYRMRLPYSNEVVSSSIQTGSAYEIRAGERAANFSVPESDVIAGARIDGPDLRS